MPGEDAERCEFTFSSTGQEVTLPEGQNVADQIKQLPPWLKSRVEKGLASKGVDTRTGAGAVSRKSGDASGGSPLEQRNPFD